MVRYQPITARRSQKSQGKQKLSEQVPAIRGQHRSPKKLPRPQSHAGTKLNLWQKGNMAGAMEEYRKQEEKPSTERLSIRLIARAWNVPYETLRRRLSGKVSKVESASGRPTILSQQSEEELAETVRKMARAGFPLSRKDIREIAYAYSDAKGIKGFSESKKIAGYYWFQGFLNRFPDISTKKAENLSAARAMGMNKTQVMKWFDLYEDLVQRLDIKDSPRHIWNVDETGVMNIHKAEEAVAIVGEPAYNLTALERGETSTVLAALNAFGDIIPPMIIHKGKTVGKGWKDGAPFGAIVKASDSGWINKDLFVEFGQLFVNNLQRLGLLNGRPHLLIMDNHYSHVFNLEFLNLMKANNIHVFALPSHTTHWLQPLDRVPFGSFKRKWNEGMRLFTRKNAVRKLEKKEFFSLFTPTWQASMTVELAQAGFRATGLFPFNAKAIPEEAFAPSTITERKLDSTASNSQPNMLSNIENSCLPLRSSIEQPPVPNAAMNLQLISVTESVDIINLNEMQLPDISNSSSAKLVDTANKDNINASNSNTRLDKQHEQHVNTDIAGSTCLPTTDENAIVSIEQADLDVSFENLMPVPHRDRPQSSRPRKKPPSYELTSEENVAFIQERTKPITKKAAKEKETSKEKKQKKTVKQKVIKKKKESKKEKKQKEEDICKYCGFAYGEATDPLIDDEWIECDACRDWLHESCIEITVRGQLCADCVQTTTK